MGREEDREEWVVRIHGGPQIATLLALQSGYKHLGPVSRLIEFPNELGYTKFLVFPSVESIDSANEWLRSCIDFW